MASENDSDKSSPKGQNGISGPQQNEPKGQGM